MARIQVILGENGQGKTRHLLDYFNNNVDAEHIAVVSNSIINPFPLIKKNNHHYYGLRARHGQTPHVLSRTINDYFIKLISNNSLRGLLGLCKLIGYDDNIIIRREPQYKIERIEPSFSMDYDHEIIHTPDGPGAYNHGRFFRRAITKGAAEMYAPYIEKSRDFYLSYNDIGSENQAFNDHLRNEVEVKEKIGMGNFRSLFSNKVYVSKNGIIYPVENASSGELYMLSLGFFLRKFLDERPRHLPKSILIDEPENSLHPKLQKKFIGFLIGFLGYDDDVKVIIATHSPFITMESDFYNADFSLCYIKDGLIFESDHQQKNNNIEQVYYELFGLLTPKNRFLSDYCNKLVRGVAESRVQFDEALDAIIGMKRVSFDNKQRAFLNDVIELLKKVHGDANG